jgi:glycosyltransferase involved in cell wall biosynthesis/GT2 family glycosyltransferase
MHHLCSLLNHAGIESYMVTNDISAELWTPKVDDATRARHHAASQRPIVVTLDKKNASSANLGLKVSYEFNLYSVEVDAPAAPAGPDDLNFSFVATAGSHRLRLPLLALEALTGSDTPALARENTLVLAHDYLARGGKATDLPAGAVPISTLQVSDAAEMGKLLSAAQLLYLYQPDSIQELARLHGCAVVCVPNELAWPNETRSVSYFGTNGLSWGTDAASVKAAVDTVVQFRMDYLAAYEGWTDDVNAFVSATQQSALAQPMSEAWPEEVVLSLPMANETHGQAALRADRIKQLRVNKQHAQWRARASLREIDGEIYGEYVASGKLPKISAVVYSDGDMEALATTLDSLSASFWQPADLTIVAPFPAPFDDDGQQGMRWMQVAGPEWNTAVRPEAAPSPLEHMQGPWTLAIKAGTTLEPHALLEFAIAAQTSSATAIYSDDDLLLDGEPQFPHFKPHTNVEWLRSTNYLGDAVLLQTRTWKKHTENHRFDGVYAFALRAIESRGRDGLHHIDSILSHGRGTLPDEQLARETEQVKDHLARIGLTASIEATQQQGVRAVKYTARSALRVSMIVPCSSQTGYLDCLLASVRKHVAAELLEVIVVVDEENADRVRRGMREGGSDAAVHIVALENQPYSHARALNAGAAAAQGDVLLFADDDTEVVHDDWLKPLLGYLEQTDVGCVAPRLVKPGPVDPLLHAGPMFLGLGGLCGAYCGERSNVLEGGVYGRLQAAQDVSVVAPHFFLVRAAQLKQVGHFDEDHGKLFYPVLDFLLRTSRVGLRHIWSPLVSVLHQGGKTLEDRRRVVEDALALQQQELAERRHILTRWTLELGRDLNYNRNLSLTTAFDLEQEIVVDWQPARHERPRVLALPVASGSGQYRVIEPLNALQEAGKVQSCVVHPVKKVVARIPTAVELVRTGMDRLIIQNAISDLHLARLEEYRKNLSDLVIVHLMDDLFGYLPGKHYLHEYHKREGDSRIRRSLELSDRLIVTTEPLRDFYKDSVEDVRIVPNALVEANWFDLPVTPRPRSGKLRVGWAGAQQHLGDLDMIQTVVAHFADRVDWIFMGMCPPSIKPHVKEEHAFVSIKDYPQTLANLDLDIAIAPLEDNPFNACKSNLRLLEYGAMGWPVVCSDVFPYRTENPPVLRVPNDSDAWIHALESLLDNGELRQSLGKGLNQWVKTKFALSQHVDAWFSAIFDPVSRH